MVEFRVVFKLLDDELLNSNATLTRERCEHCRVIRYRVRPQQSYIALLFDRNEATFERLHSGKNDKDDDRRADRRAKEGMSNKEIHRCLKRYIVRELYPLILADLADSTRVA